MPKRTTEGAWMLGTDNVVKWYLDMTPEDAPYYSVWSKSPRVLKFSYDAPDKILGGEMLRTNLEPAQENGMDNILVIRLHKVLDKNGITDRSPYWASTDFRLCAAEEYEPGSVTGYGGSYGTLQARIAALEAGGIREEKPSIMGAIQGLIDTPEVRPVIAAALAGFLSRIGVIPAAAVQGALYGGAMNGVDEDPGEDPGLPVSQKDLELMTRLSKDNPEMFTGLITQLRAMYAEKK